jgi:hypothetical protein
MMPVVNAQNSKALSKALTTRARIRAYENALKESETSQKYAHKVSDFVREGFEPKSEN